MGGRGIHLPSRAQRFRIGQEGEQRCQGADREDKANRIFQQGLETCTFSALKIRIQDVFADLIFIDYEEAACISLNQLKKCSQKIINFCRPLARVERFLCFKWFTT